MGNAGAHHFWCSLDSFLEGAVRARLGVREGKRGTRTYPGLNAALGAEGIRHRARGHGRRRQQLCPPGAVTRQGLGGCQLCNNRRFGSFIFLVHKLPVTRVSDLPVLKGV